MITLRNPNRSVTPADFRGPHGVSQNPDCLAPLQSPFQTVSLCLPGRTLQTVSCASCTPQPAGGRPAPDQAYQRLQQEVGQP
jgi:hypothetical protein